MVRGLVLRISSLDSPLETLGVVVFLCKLVQRGALLYGHEALDAELLAGLLHGLGPLGEAGGLEDLLAGGVLFLANNFPSFIQHQVLLGEAAPGAVRRARPHAALGSNYDLLLRGASTRTA